MKSLLIKIYNFLEDLPYLLRPEVFPKDIKIKTTEQTLEAVRYALENRLRGAYLRFGDGDVNLMRGKDELLQPSNPDLQKEMQEAFSLTGEGIFKCLPLHSLRFGQEPGMKPGLHSSPDSWAERILRRSYKYFAGQDIYSHVALAYLSVFKREKAVAFLKFLKTLNPIFVGNESVPIETVQSLFGKTIFIKTPAKAAYSQMERIEQEAVSALEARRRDYDVIVVAMGCSGRVFEKRILKNYSRPVFLFDFGSLLDALSGNNTRAWMGLAGLPEDYWTKLLLSL